MNLIEAIKSGKTFRRLHSRHCRDWLYVSQAGLITALHTGCSGPVMHASDLLAEDWETSEPEVTITLSQFDKAWGEAIEGEPYFLRAKLDLARKLGLKV